MIYEQTHRCRLTEESDFGYDPLEGHEDLCSERGDRFSQRFSIPHIFNECVNRRQQSLKDAILNFIELTEKSYI